MARLFEAQLQALDDPGTPPECFVANALNELGQVDGALGWVFTRPPTIQKSDANKKT